MENSQIDCEYLSNDGICKAITKNQEGKSARDEFCANKVRTSCCLTCSNRAKCEISCSYNSAKNKQRRLTQTTQINEEMNKEISKYEKNIEKLSFFLADGKISEASYLRLVKKFEDRISRLNGLKKNPDLFAQHQLNLLFDEEASDSYEKPSIAWYLAPLFLGLIGGLLGYVGTKDRDNGMALGLLISGAFSAVIRAVFFFIWFSVFLHW